MNHKLTWLNTKDDIIDAMGDAVISMKESGAYSDSYILSYVDEFINHKCEVAFIDFSPSEEKYARIDMYHECHMLLGLD